MFSNDRVELLISSLDMHLTAGHPPREALARAVEDYAAVFHTDDGRTELQRAATVALARLREDSVPNDHTP